LFLLIQAKQCLKIIFKKRLTHEDIIVTLNTLTTRFPQIAKANDFSLLKMQDFPQTSFVPHHPFLKDILKQKNSNTK
jgi:hypothetical protein